MCLPPQKLTPTGWELGFDQRSTLRRALDLQFAQLVMAPFLIELLLSKESCGCLNKPRFAEPLPQKADRLSDTPRTPLHDRSRHALV